ncbi:hypothetical protein ON010_g4933 [Phytophthora cinnamomi]|nr:hypothetical protein ON010_g4933 [Phytophthora cinnamomi]
MDLSNATTAGYQQQGGNASPRTSKKREHPVGAGRPTGNAVTRADIGHATLRTAAPSETSSRCKKQDDRPNLVILKVYSKRASDSLRALVDSGASNNFVRLRSLPRLDFEEVNVPRRLATGAIVKTEKRVVNVRFSYKQRVFVERFIVLDLDDKFGVVMGMPCKPRHDPVIDWKKRTLVRFGRDSGTESDGPITAAHAPAGVRGLPVETALNAAVSECPGSAEGAAAAGAGAGVAPLGAAAVRAVQTPGRDDRRPDGVGAARARQKKLAAASAAEERERRQDKQLAGRNAEEPSKEPETDSDDKLNVVMKPVTADACYEVIRAAYAEVCNFRTSRELYTSKQQVLGWTHRYRLEGENLQYSICKFFSGVEAQELSDRGWAIMTTESSYKALHSRGMTSNLHDIQTVNGDNRVFCRELQRPAQRTVMQTLFLSSRFQTAEGYMTIYRALDHEKFGFTGVSRPKTESNPAKDTLNSRPSEPNVVWLDMFAWTSFENRSDGSGVEFQFGGEMKHFSADNAKFWMMEVLLMALRWESRTVGPLITLQG